MSFTIDSVFLYADFYENKQEHLGLLQAIATNADLTAKTLLDGRLSLLDPIVHDDSCLVRGLAIVQIGRDDAVLEEAKQLRVVSKKAIGNISSALSGKTRGKETLSFSSSSQLIFLQLAHLLTVAKIFKANASGHEVAKIDLNSLRSKLRVKNLVSIESLGKLVDHCQHQISEISVCFIQEEAFRLSVIESKFLQIQLQVVETIAPPVSLSTRKCCCLFYNTKTVLLRARELRIPIFVREHEESTLGIICRSEESGEFLQPISSFEAIELADDLPILVVHAFLPSGFDQNVFERHVSEETLEKLILSSVALNYQYSIQNEDPSKFSPEALQELEGYRGLGVALGCQLPNPRALTAVHIHASTVNEERGRYDRCKKKTA
ncbi:MAG: hypothetical protein V4494_03270 [Chlamydiota bacterium]